MDNASCKYYYAAEEEDGGDQAMVFTYLPISFISMLLCLATIVLVCKQKLHKALVYRLATYQVLSAMEFSILWIIAGTLAISAFTNFNAAIANSPTTRIVLNALLMGSSFMKLMFTVWISLHLFALAVFHKNLQRLERLYVVSSLLVHLVATIVLLSINLTVCSRDVIDREEIIYIIIFAVLVLISLLMVVMGTILCHRACRRRNAILSEYDKQHKKALCEILPLLLYPIFFLLFTTPIFGLAVYDFEPSYSYEYGPNTTIMNVYFSNLATFMFPLLAPCWSFTTSLLLIFHLCAVRCFKKRKVRNILRKVKQQYNTEEGSVTINETTRLCQKSYTHFSAPNEE